MNAPFKIQTGIEMPPSHASLRKYRLCEMEVGDSFTVPFHEDGPKKTQARVCAVASRYGKKHGKRFETRLLDGEVGCWRMA